MKKAVVMLLTFCVTAGQFMPASVYAQQQRRRRDATPTRPAPPERPRADLFAKFPVDEPRRIDLEMDEASLDGMSRRERLEQVRDWLLLTTVAASGASLDEINQALYDQPSVRHGYMQQLANFEYGETRSRYVGGGAVVALLPGGSRSRDDQLARIADQQRKDLGEPPASLVPFEYRIDLDSNTALLVRRPTIPAAELFTEAYGYHQARVGSLADLNDFMTRVDDVTFADAGGGALTLGGRKIKGRGYGRIGVEEIAAVWQAQSGPNAEVKRLKAARKQLVDHLDAEAKRRANEFNQRWAAFKVGPNRFLIPTQYSQQFEQEKAKVKSDVAAMAAAAAPTLVRIESDLAEQEMRVSKGTGFSLDPAYDYDRLAVCFEQQVEPELRELMSDYPEVFSGRDLETAKAGLAGKNTEPFTRLLNKLTDGIGVEAARHFRAMLEMKCSIQNARYDGPPRLTLQGTEAGMVLFYTDLLAKLWMFEKDGSTPSRQIEDFRSSLAVPVSPVHREEVNRLSSTRLWFGPRDKGYQITGRRKEQLLFARNATRVFSASRDPLETHAQETEPNAASAAFIGWWDGHYEEVARYEPQYERLNAIMKWSLIVGWLNDLDRGDLLAHLASVPVNRSYWFPDWVRQHRDELKFTRWDEIKFYPRGRDGSAETLPFITSRSFTRFGDKGAENARTISGGVSLAGRAEVAKRLPLTARTFVGRLLRRAGIDLSASRPGEVRMLEGTSYKIERMPAGSARIVSTPRPGAKARLGYGELTGQPQAERVLSQQGGRYVIETRVAEVKDAQRVEVSAGRLSVEETGNGFKIGRQGRELDVGLALARRVSGSRDPVSLLSRSPDVEAAFVIPGRGYLIKTRGAIDKWLSLEYAEAPGGAAQARVADLAEHARELRLQWLDPSSAGRFIGDSLGVRLTDGSSLNPLLMIGERPRSATRVLVVEKDGRVLRGVLDERTGTAYFNKAELPSELRSDPERLSKLLNASDLRELNRLASASPGDIRYVPRAGADFVTELARADGLIAEGNSAAALDYLERLEGSFPGRWELEARKGLAQLKRGKVEDAAAAFEALRQNPSADLKVFYDHLASVLSNLKAGGNRWSASDMGGGKFRLELTLSDGLKGQVVSDAAEIGKDGAVYLPNGVDNPGVSLRQILMDVIARPSSGTVVKVRHGDIAAYDPTVVHDPVRNVRYEFKGTTGDTGRASPDGWASSIIQRQAARNLRPPRQRSVFFGCCDDDDGDGICNEDEDDAREEDEDSCVYVVLPPGHDRTVR